jgi:exopolysaccharide biosynthesis polyprenyl glycosylphosphotransferase
MFRETNKIYLFYFLIDILLISIAFYLPYSLRFNYHFFQSLDLHQNIIPNQKEYLFIFCIWGMLIILSLKGKNLYSTDRSLGILKESRLVSTTIVTVSLFIAAIIFFTQFKFFSRSLFGFSCILLSFFLIGWRLGKRIALRYLIRQGFHNFNVLIIGTDGATPLILEEINRNPFLGLKVAGMLTKPGEKPSVDLSLLGGFDDFEGVCKKCFIDEVLISSSIDAFSLSKIVKSAKNMHLGIRVIPLGFEGSSLSLSIYNIGIVPLLTYKERKFHPTDFFGKRAFDVFLSLILLLILSPLFLLITLMILFDDGRPIFYVQKRMGRKEEIFNFYKFRSMVKNADELKDRLLVKNEVKDGVIFKIRKDPRITRAGKVLRRYSFDELPQLFNVLKGNMSLVGPRPFPISETQKIDKSYITRLNIRPGVTGLAQIKGRSDLPFNHWMKWDLWYIKNWSFGIDLKILWWTFSAVIKGKGAY